MIKADEIPVNAKQAREVLGWSNSYMSAVRRAMGIKSRYFFLSDVRKFLRTNPTFTSAQIYHPGRCACADCREKRSHRLQLKPMTTTGVKVTRTEPAPITTLRPTTSESLQIQSQAELFAQKLCALRGSYTVEELSTLAGVSRETIRKAEHAILPKLATVQRIAKASGASRQDQQELITLWFKAQAAEAGAGIRIEVVPPEDEAGIPAMPSIAEVLMDQLLTLQSGRREQMLKLFRSREWVAHLCNFICCMAEIPKLAVRPVPARCKPQNSLMPAVPPPLANDDVWRTL